MSEKPIRFINFVSHKLNMFPRFKLSADLEIRGLALYLSKKKCLIISDLHIGYEEALNKEGVLIPRFSFNDIINQLKGLLTERYKLVIINGDLKHDFGEISNQEWQETTKFLNILKQHTERILLIKGNHDTVLEPIIKRKDIEIRESVELNGYLVLHGHKIPPDFNSKDTAIIAHEHPAVSLFDGVRVERYKCFLVGSFKKTRLIVMPSFSPLMPGNDLATSKPLSPFLSRNNMNSFDVFIIADRIYNFGKLGELIKMHS